MRGRIPSRTDAFTKTAPQGEIVMRSSSIKQRNNFGETRNCEAPNSKGVELRRQ